MKKSNRKLLLVIPTLLVATMASAQIRHGLAIDFGKSHMEDTTRVTRFSVGVTSHTDTLKGVQANMLSNYAGCVNGLQFSGFSNISTSPMRGAQFSSVTNISMGVEKGLQAASLLNVSSGLMRGVQMSAYNYAEELNGLQLGVFNVANSHPKGWQVGIISKTIFSAIPKRNDPNSKLKRKTKWSFEHQIRRLNQASKSLEITCFSRGFFLCKNLSKSK